MMNRINWTELKPQIQQVGRLSLPAILTQITTIAMQYIDSAMVGALGANASAAIGLVFVDDVAPQRYDLCGFSRFSVQVAHQIGEIMTRRQGMLCSMASRPRLLCRLFCA